MRVLMLTCDYVPERYGGAQQQCHRLSRALIDAGHEVTVLTSRTSDAYAAREILDGVEVHRIRVGAPPQIGGRHLASMVWWIIRVLIWLTRRRTRFDLLHMHQAKANAFAGTFAGWLLGLPTLVKVGNGGRGFDFHTLERKRFLYGVPMARFVRRHAERVVAISSHLAREIADYGVAPDRIVLIPNGIEELSGHAPQDIGDLRHRLGLASDRRYLLFAGRLERQKQVDLLLEAFAELHRSHPDITLLLLGDGELRAGLEAQAEALGLAPSVIFAGRVENVRDYMIAADLFVLPSIAEGLSNALLEAMRDGLVPIATRVSGSADLISDGVNGLLCEPDSLPSLVQALQRAAEIPIERLEEMAVSARQTVREGYTMPVIRARYEELYQQLCGGKAKPAPRAAAGSGPAVPPRAVPAGGPAVSVIVNCYNESATIGAAIESVLSQSAFDRIDRIVVVDDGSTDASPAVIDDYGKNVEKLTSLRQENAGLAAARNRGLADLAAPYVAFLDGDDLWLPEKLEAMLSYVDRMPEVGLFFSDYIDFEDSGGLDRVVRVKQYDKDDPRTLERLFVHGGPIIPSTTIVKREAFQACGHFDTSLRTKQDADMWLRIAARFPLQRVPSPLVRKRSVAGSLGSFKEENAVNMRRITEKAVAANPRLQGLRRGREARIAADLVSNYLARSRRRDALRVLLGHTFSFGPNPKLLAYLAIALSPLPCRYSLAWMKALHSKYLGPEGRPRPA